MQWISKDMTASSVTRLYDARSLLYSLCVVIYCLFLSLHRSSFFLLYFNVGRRLDAVVAK